MKRKPTIEGGEEDKSEPFTGESLSQHTRVIHKGWQSPFLKTGQYRLF